MTQERFSVTAPLGAPEVRPGDDLASMLVHCAHASDDPVVNGDIVVISSKVVSKSEGRLVIDRSRDEVIAEETAEVVARRDDLVIARTRHGLVLAAAGVDTSNVAPGAVLPLPVDPDESARQVRAKLRQQHGVRVGVIVSDTAGRAWRIGQTDIAIGCAGVVPVVALEGSLDRNGNELRVTSPAVADELAGAAELVMQKAAGRPFAVVRGLAHLLIDDDGPGAQSIVRDMHSDLFRRGYHDR